MCASGFQSHVCFSSVCNHRFLFVRIFAFCAALLLLNAFKGILWDFGLRDFFLIDFPDGGDHIPSMKSILIRYADRVVRYTQGENTSEERYDSVIDALYNYAPICGMCLDKETAFNDMGWSDLYKWESIQEIAVDEEEEEIY